MKKLSHWLLAALAAALVMSCANQKAPAEQAVAVAEAALAAVRDSAQKYAPDQLQAVEDQLKGLKDSLAKGDYKAVLTGAPTVNSAINSLKDAAEAKKADADAAAARAKDAWGPVSADVPMMIEAIAKRVDSLSKSHRLPKGVTKQGLAAAKSGLDSLKSQWTEATSAATSGDYTTAMAKAEGVKTKAAEMMRSLGMSSG
ncbi:MAG: hypothetical protein E6K28_07055 [Gammaproteobacteria bacterium]|nr:MAG: hypothetical protein E6K31_13145 [Gammaproteobacteria bacterium]TLZ09559.1 MAG: hypothetical protein E6K28_07055 [Gammaproteobacteria bacterium]